MPVEELATGIGVGRGAVMASTWELLFSDFAEFSIRIPVEILEVGIGQMSGNKVRLPLGQEFLGTVACHSINPRMLAGLIGATNATAATRPKFKERDNLTRISPALTITLSKTPSEVGAIELINSDGNRYDQVGAGTEVAGKSYSIAGTTATFAAGEAATRFYPSYFYAETGGTSVVPSPGAIPSKFKLYGAVSFYGRSDLPEQITMVAKKTIRTGEIAFGGAENAHEPIRFDVAFENFFDDDITFYFPASWS